MMALMRLPLGFVRSQTLNALELLIRFIARTGAISAPSAFVFGARTDMIGARQPYFRTVNPSAVHAYVLLSRT
jgi:hypothetical protein